MELPGASFPVVRATGGSGSRIGGVRGLDSPDEAAERVVDAIVADAPGADGRLRGVAR
jgi:hypothetical protein